ncbi:DUF1905 domain-containing protein [Taibaiella lutea]|uniref:DUF1905 domain-containing protein n=1 Tax=Taibaiella lutea TaxID=2608001 RepID=A0A5M6CME4_9BACT|nr:YdeI/OmpD-associated family protein [Taibaiella lutea]KAA5534485.1 DUF1905 domain-containing protein [Taibaiella lutea]
MKTFTAVIDIIGINPFVFVPEDVLACVFLQSGKNKGPIPVKGTIDGHTFMQTLVRYSNAWRLYINTPMLQGSGKKTGDEVSIMLAYDDAERTVPVHPKLMKALKENKEAKSVFDKLNPSLQKEIKRYIHNLKTEAAIDKNVAKAIRFLIGKERFIGRDGLG